MSILKHSVWLGSGVRPLWDPDHLSLSTFLYRTASVKGHSATPPSMSRRKDFHVYSSTTRRRHRNHTAESDAKYCISVDMAKVMLDGTSELEGGKNCDLPFGKRCPRLQKRCLTWIPVFRNSMHLELDEMQSKAEVTNTSRIKFSH